MSDFESSSNGFEGLRIFDEDLLRGVLAGDNELVIF